MKKPLFIFICWDMASGKSTISKEICEKFPQLNYVNSDLIRDYFRENYPYYRDLDNSYPSPKVEKLNEIINPLRESTLQLLTEARAPILFNKSGLTYNDRKYFLDLIPNEEYTKILIQTQIDEQELQERITKRDITDETSKNWLKFHNEMRIGLRENIKHQESEYTITYDQTNLDIIIELIKKHI